MLDWDTYYVMTDWIEKLSEHHLRAQEERDHKNATIPSLAGDLFEKLAVQVKSDIDKINGLPPLIRALGGELQYLKSEAVSSFEITQATPFKKVAATLDPNGHIIKVTLEVIDGQGKSILETVAILKLDLNKDDTIQLKDKAGNKLSLEGASQHLLERFLALHSE